MPSSQSPEPSAASRFLQSEVYRLGAQPGLRSLPQSPERDFLTLTWGPIIYRTTYAPESDRLLPIFLRALNDETQQALPRCLSGTPKQIHLLETTYASKVFSIENSYEGADEATIRKAFRQWKIALALPSFELPVRLRICLIVDDVVLASLTKRMNAAVSEDKDRDFSRCPVKVVEENFPDKVRKNSNPAVGPYPGWTTVVLSSLVEVYNGLRHGNGLVEYHQPGRIYTGNGQWDLECDVL
ncbi:hypothetical protein N8T08_002304 [Aspergillus melleus]|uniref:Uncharacterized protein n=1 Tax=Aspergillus melleus TaxID=138277 RepID=A0ACC3B8P3_9EURO|nr:hypothetical protein N8T08_002304 [Aspergillus melleus]